MAAPTSLESLLERIRVRASSDAHAWLLELTTALRGGVPAERLLRVFPSVARRLGRSSLLAGAELGLRGPQDHVPLDDWSLDVAGRCALLLAFAAGTPEALPATLESAYHEGDSLEKIAVVRSLSLLPDSERFTGIALDAGRTNETELFRAVALANPFPARHYPELEFNKLVMKAAFVRAPLDRILGLDRRANAELSRMAMDHIDEQESAQRSFVPEIWLAVAPHPPPGAVGRMLGYLSHGMPGQRRGAARGLLRAGQPRTRSFLAERLEVERDAAVRNTLLEALSELDR